MPQRPAVSSNSLWTVNQSRSRMRDRLLPVVFPILCFLAFRFGGEVWLLISAFVLPLIFLLFQTKRSARPVDHTDSVTGLMKRDTLMGRISSTMAEIHETGRTTACFLVDLDEYSQIADRQGDAAAEQVLCQIAQRLTDGMRDTDFVARTGDSQFAVCLNPVRHLDLEICIQMAARLQAAIEEPVHVDGATLYSSCSVGFCLASRAKAATAEDLFSTTALALAEAKRQGPSAIRSYSEDLAQKSVSRTRLWKEASDAMRKDQIQAWFQPQISTDTGRVTGFEALARWEHPTLGIVPPLEFLDALEASGQLERLAEHMLHQALTAQQAWDAAGFHIPHVGVNFAGDELRNPALVEKIKWELDRFDLSPDRIAIEVLETVVARSDDDMVARNINGLARLGCLIDLDDFGTGHSSISSIRRFAVSRLKIDRSFVMKADQDPEQQRMIAAIVTMAERLDLQTLAEGVETVGEHAILSQLGCGHVQGFGISRPMPFSKTMQWISAHNAKLQTPPEIGRKTG